MRSSGGYDAVMRVIKKISIGRRGHALVARESHWRYLLFYWCVTLASFLVISAWRSSFASGFPLLVFCACAFALTLLSIYLPPLHWELALDTDEECWRSELRVVGLLRLRRQEWSVAEHTLVGRDAEYEEAEEDVGLGCLSLLLPFPFNLIMHAVSGNTKTVTRYWHELALEPVLPSEATHALTGPPRPRRTHTLAVFPNERHVLTVLEEFHEKAPEAVVPVIRPLPLWRSEREQ